MRFLILFLFPVFAFSQIKLDTVSILDGKIKMLAPKELSVMTAEIWAVKYQKKIRPFLALSDAAGEVNLLADYTQQPATENQLSAIKDFQIQQLKTKRSDFILLSEGINNVNGKKNWVF